MEEKEDEEFKKRIRELVKNVEKKDPDSQYTEQDLKEARERLIQTIKKRTHEDKYRNEFIIMTSTLWIQSLYRHKIEDQHQDEIDTFYEIIFEQLKKPFMYTTNLDPTTIEIVDKKRILRNMENVLGKEKVDFFKKKYNLSKLIGSTLKSEQILKRIEEERKAQQRFDTKMGLIIGIPCLAFIFGFWFVWNFSELFMVLLSIFALIVWIWFTIAKRRGRM
jgi:hypothetical protein